MENKFLKTIAFQVSDPDFFEEYEKRQKESGLKVKDYFFSLIRADIAQHQSQTDSPVQEAADTTSQTAKLQSEEASEETAEQAEELSAPTESEEPTEEASTPAESPEQAAEEPVQNEEMMNLFVKLPREQRVALECHKNESGEAVGSILNRLIDDFLEHTRRGDLPEGYADAYRPYFHEPKSCDTKASAKIPSKTNQELSDYISLNDGSRNALMAALVELELNKQEMSEEETHGQGMEMSL